MAEAKDFILKGGKKESNSKQKMPEVNFSTFVMSLNASALASFGALNDPVTGKKNVNLSAGKQTIDILAMLKEKTSGNLTSDELKLLDNVIYELRMIYVKQKK